VQLDVVRGRAEQLRVIAEETEPVIAPLAEQLPRRSADVVVVEVLRLRISADRAAVVLTPPEVGKLPGSQLVLAVEVRGAARSAVTALAATAEFGGRA
jgi:hypothetical protein